MRSFAARGSSRSVAVGVLAGIGLSTLVVTALPDHRTGVVTACASRSDGATRLVGTDSRCRGSEKQVRWRTGWRVRGGWATSARYRWGDVVRSSGASYVALRTSQGKAPQVWPTFWALVARDGRDGTNGADGADAPTTRTVPLSTVVAPIRQIISAGALYNTQPIPGTTVTVAGPTTVTASGVASLGVSSTPATALVGLCYLAPGQVVNAEWLQTPVQHQFSEPDQPVPVAASGPVPAGTFQVSVCVRPTGDLDDNGQLSGWMVVRPG